MKWLEVRDRDSAKEYSSEMPWAAICVSSTSNNWTRLNFKNCVATLQIYFLDCHNYQHLTYGFLFGGLFSQQHARQILSFTKRHWNYVDSFLIQCDKGDSCSAAIAAAIMYIYYGEQADDWYFEHKNPNMLVYGTIIKSHHFWL